VQNEGGERPGAQAAGAALPPPPAPATPGWAESGADDADGAALPGPETPGPVTDLALDGTNAGAADAVREQALIWAGGWPDYWRLTPWLVGLTAAAVGAEVVRRRRQAAAEAARAAGPGAEEALWGLPGLWPAEDV
jgi:hypothetical protein